MLVNYFHVCSPALQQQSKSQVAVPKYIDHFHPSLLATDRLPTTTTGYSACARSSSRRSRTRTWRTGGARTASSSPGWVCRACQSWHAWLTPALPGWVGSRPKGWQGALPPHFCPCCDPHFRLIDVYFSSKLLQPSVMGADSIICSVVRPLTLGVTAWISIKGSTYWSEIFKENQNKMHTSNK